jgi:hypothetical protein
MTVLTMEMTVTSFRLIKKDLYAILFLITTSLFATAAHAADLCNAGGADPLVCKSNDGKTEILIHPRGYDPSGIATNGFCDSGYIKLNGIELNGNFQETLPAALELTTAIHANFGVNVLVPGSKSTKVLVSDSIAFQFSDAGVAKAAGFVNADEYVNFLLPMNQKTATLYFSLNGLVEKKLTLVCSGQ